MTITELKRSIVLSAQRFQPADDWEAQVIEWNTILDIFEYALANGFQPPDYDLRALLDADDDESPGVPEMGCEAAFIDLMERIERTDLPNAIDAPEIAELFRFFELQFRGPA